MSISRVQSNQATGGSTSVSSVAITLPTGVTQGNLLTVCFGYGATADTVTLPDASWAVASDSAGATSKQSAEIYYLLVDSGHAGQTSWTFTVATANKLVITVAEWNSTSGWAASPLDVAANNSATTTSTTVSSGTTATTAQASELWIAALSYGQSAQTETGLTSGWTSGQEASISAAHVLRECYQAASATGTASCSITLGTAEHWGGCVATFKTASSTTNTWNAPTDSVTATESVAFTLSSTPPADTLTCAETIATTAIFVPVDALTCAEVTASTEVFLPVDAVSGTDDFTRANNASSWTKNAQGFAWSLVKGNATLAIASNTATLTGGTSGFDHYVELGTLGLDKAEVLVKFKLSSGAILAGPFLRAQNTDPSQATYIAATNLPGGNQFGISYQNAGSFTQLVHTSGFNFGTNQTYWTRMQTNGSLLRAKLWLDGNTEPTAWDIAITDTNLTGQGWFGWFTELGTPTDVVTVYQYTVIDLAAAAYAADSVSAATSGTVTMTGTDTLTCAESLLSTDVFTPTENVSTSDQYGATVVSVGTDSLAPSESYTAANVFTPIEQVSVSDLFALTTLFHPTEQLSTTESSNELLTVVAVDQLSVADTASETLTKLATDQLTTSDAASATLSVTATDTATVSDRATTTLVFAPLEQASATDQYGATLLSTGSDSLSAGDATLTTESILLVDAAPGLSDSFAFTDLPVMNSVDTLTCSDALSSRVALSITENAATSDQVGITQAAQGTDALLAADTAAYSAVYTPVDSLVANETFTGLYTVTAVDSASASDTLTKTLAFTPLESVTLSETSSASLALHSSDNGTVSDTFGGTLSTTFFADTAVPADAYTVSLLFVPIEQAVAADAVVDALAFSATDSAALSDTLDFTTNNDTAIHLTDAALVPSDVFVSAIFYQGIDASLVVVDSLAASIQRVKHIIGVVRGGQAVGYLRAGAVTGVLRSGATEGLVRSGLVDGVVRSGQADGMVD